LGFFLLVGTFSLGAGLLAGLDPLIFAQCASLVVGATLCFVGPKSRLVISVVGALLVFQSDFTSLKYGYLAVAFLCFLLSLRSIFDPGGGIRREFRALVVCSALLACYLAFTFVVSRSNDISSVQWFRDALPYFLLVLLPYIGIAAGPAISPRWNHWWFIAIGLAVSVGLTADWLHRRGVSALPFGRFVLSSTVVVALCFAYAITQAGLPRNPMRWWWGTISLIILVAVLLTGSRSNLVLLAAFAGIIGSARDFRVTPRRAWGVLFGLLLTLVVVTPLVANLLVSDPDFLNTRINDALAVLQGHADADASYAMRKASYDLTAEALTDHLALGTGPGYLYPTPPKPTFNLDAPGIVPAKFGLFGLAFIGAFLLSVAVSVRNIRRAHGPSPAFTASRGWLVVLIALVPFGPWLEDKGFPVALAMLFAAVISDARPESSECRPPTAPQSDSVGAGRVNGVSAPRVLSDTLSGLAGRADTREASRPDSHRVVRGRLARRAI